MRHVFSSARLQQLSVWQSSGIVAYSRAVTAGIVAGV